MAQQSGILHFVQYLFYEPAILHARCSRCAILPRMVKVLEKAIAKVSTLPEAAQEKIGEELLLHVAKVHRLRAGT